MSESSMTAPVIRIRDLSTRFGEVWIHKGLNLDIERGEMVSLVGGSGSGKTTLLRMVIGLLLPDAGSIELFGEPLFGGGVARERALRQRFGVLFQQGALFSAFNVYDNIAFPLRELKRYDEDAIHDLVMLKLSHGRTAAAPRPVDAGRAFRRHDQARRPGSRPGAGAGTAAAR
jgi:phospholipid/cholesterol/gamma-HCH transport system ATP-binding protein